MAHLSDDDAARTGLGTLAMLPLLVASDSAAAGLALGLALLASLTACAIAAALIGARLATVLRGLALATFAAIVAAAMQLALQALVPPSLDAHDALLLVVAANGAFGWLAVSRGEAGVSAAALRGALALGLGGTLALIAVGAVRDGVGGLLATPIGGFALLAVLLAGWQAWQQHRRRADASVGER